MTQTQTLAAQLVQNAAWRIAGRRPDTWRIIDAVAQAFGVSASELTGPLHRPECVVPRHIAMYLMRERLGLSYPAIGREFGGRNHTGVIYGVRRVVAMRGERVCGEVIRRIEEELDRG